MSCATVVPEQPPMRGNGSSNAISAQAPSFAVEPAAVEEAPGSLASKPRRAVARALTSVTTVPLPAAPRVMPCCEKTPAMVMIAISSPAADVFGWFQIFEMGFIRKAPRKEKGGHSRLGYHGIWQARERPKLLPRNKNRGQRRAPFRPATGLDLSHLPEFERHRGCGSGSRQRAAEVQIRDGPAPRKPSAGGGRTHSPGSALPSLVWLPFSLGNPGHIFCRDG